MRRLLHISIAVALAGCSGATLPPPTVVSVDPPERPASSSGPVTVTIDAVLPTVVDFGAASATVDDRVTVRVGTWTFATRRWADAGAVGEFVPSVLAEGRYDVMVQLGDGRQTTAMDAFRVTPGDWPVGYTIDTIPTQSAGVPFAVTLHARGAPDGGYGGTVNLSTSKGAVTPAITGAFDAGVRVEVITVTGVQSGDSVQLTAEDLAGHTGTSLSFHIR